MSKELKQSESYFKDSQIIWDAHSCLPLSGNEPLSVIQRHKEAGYDYVSINIGMDKQSADQIFATLNRFRNYIQNESSICTLVGNITELHKAKAAGLLAISFDLEGLQGIAHDLSLLSPLYDLGLRQVALAYNQNNSLCGGCLNPDVGLTKLGRESIQLANNLGLFLDCSHISHQASLEVMTLSEQPVIFSHANPAALKKHPRNLSNQQILMCARQGGVIGVNGIGILLGDNCSDTELWHKHFKYLIDLVGWQHVGIGLDHCYSTTEMSNFAAENPVICQPYKKLKMVCPEQLDELISMFSVQGYSVQEIEGILGDNFQRVAAQVWNNN
jgi:membrane dipeptidase